MNHPSVAAGAPIYRYAILQAGRIKLNRLLLVFLFLLVLPAAKGQQAYLRNLQVVTGTGTPGHAGQSAAVVLREEITKRTGIPVTLSSSLPAAGNVILLLRAGEDPKLPFVLPQQPARLLKPESYRLLSLEQNHRTILVVEGYDGRGIFYGAGELLRRFGYARGAVRIPNDLPVSSAPSKPMRGHQLGYRNTANSYDAWTVAQFDQYIRELAIFGTNSIESIPIFEEEKSPHFKLSPDSMNASISAICDRYDLDYWIWVPAQFDLKDTALRARYLDRIRRICVSSVRLNGVFFPGGDPGDNPPETVWPLLSEVAQVLKKYHPSSKVWLSLQGYTPAQSQTVYHYIQDQHPGWLGGLVTGPSSPPVEESRAALPPQYPLRYYPDLTHNVRCDWPVPWWDPAFNFTLGRESVNPRPMHYAALYHFVEPFMDGFISYSDGVHDDVNKITWTRLAWDPSASERQILCEYANFFFNSAVRETAADGLLALETNWQGPAASNGSIQGTWTAWRQMELRHPALREGWRWQMYLLRANYDAYVRLRGLYEAGQEEKANAILAQAGLKGPDWAIGAARHLLNQVSPDPFLGYLHQRVVTLCDTLFHSIGLQTSVKKYRASGEERGAVLDFLDHPLNNRWWLEDRFSAISRTDRAGQVAALEQIACWEHPGPGSYYDDIGNVGKSAHVLRGEPWTTDPLIRRQDSPSFDWWEDGFSRQRLSWMSSMRWPISLEYNGLDSSASYTVRVTGFGECLLKANGKRLEHTRYGKGIGEIKEFPVPGELIRNGRLSVGFDEINEDSINWRQQSRVTEVWLIKNPRK